MSASFGTLSLTSRRLAFSLALGLTGLMGPAFATEAASDQEMRQALSDARSSVWDTMDQKALSQHVLEGYLTYHRLLQQLPSVAPATINQFISAHQDSPVSEWMRNQAQLQYGKAGNMSALLAVSNETLPKNLQAQCYLLSARLMQAAPVANQAAADARELWRSGQNIPNECNGLFTQLRDTARLDNADDWQRMMTVWRKGDMRQVDQLRKRFEGSPRWQGALSAFDSVRNQPEAVAQLPALSTSDGHAREALIYSSLYRYARQNTAAALSFWQARGNQLVLMPEQRTQLEHDLLQLALSRQTPGFNSWVDQRLMQRQDDDLTLLRIRNALLAQSWQDVIRWVDHLSPRTHGDARWQYWQGRALAALDRQQEANAAFKQAAQGHDFYAFVAADRLHQPYALPIQPATVDNGARQRLSQIPAIQRIQALYKIDEPSLALSEWQWLLKNASPEERRQFAAFAQSQQWYNLTVAAALDRRIWDAIELRFPLAYPDMFNRWAATRQLDTYLLMGVARRESAYNPVIQSSAGARGLMQLMPATAKHVSRKEGIPYAGVSDLNDPDTNIALGSAYLRSLLDRYQGNRIAAVAAYNAGPNRVDRWLSTSDLPFDLFIEQIPFKETREYVLAVLSYRTILERQAQPGSQLPVLTAPERMRTYNSDLVNFQPNA
ncbi:transglycosylase SLT domain-containing protein [Zymobacter sp. IVIA_5232.4 C2]|uniref:transglycosylase SLT domain-containing protein n=1 Tax=Zymobacter sp. IVIA_5232.4 C2 TaxID=3394855 RepID=UPI0039C2AE63